MVTRKELILVAGLEDAWKTREPEFLTSYETNA